MSGPNPYAADPPSARPACPACGAGDLEVFHEQDGIPVNSCLLVDDEATARSFPTGDLRLAFCPACGFVTNTAFDPVRSEYSARYEETQGFSPRFRQFAEDLARRWIDRHDLHRRRVVEIGCGKGEFLELLCKLGDNRGTGIDPAYVDGRLGEDDRLAFIADFWSPAYADLPADAVVCRHTLEHIAPVGRFLADVRAAVAERPDTLVLFELPDARRVFEEPAFWDVYYEHCSYFSAGSLARLFRRHGFDVVDLALDYDDQYLLLDARPTPPGRPPGRGTPPLPLEDDLEAMAAAVAGFPRRFAEHTAALRAEVEAAGGRGGPVAIWGAGSKGVSFLTTLGLGTDEVAAAVDVNPHKQGRYLAGTGHPVIAPEALVDLRPGTVFVMNGIYTEEIRDELAALGLGPTLVPL